jgi:putative FAD dependent oxidoreductase
MEKKVIVGAGLYGLYSALYLAKKQKNFEIIVLEYDSESFKRATFINQARVHMGYHYPRSLSTAEKSAHYFRRFMEDYEFSVLTQFDQVYATSSHFSWTNAEQFVKFCKDAGIRCDEVDPRKYFNEGMCDGAFLTEEYTYDAKILRDYFLEELRKYPNVSILYNQRILSVDKNKEEFVLHMGDGREHHTRFLLNATYASTNQVSALLGFEAFKIKYELCEIILCDVNDKLRDIGLTVMDGPFFSIMPFGKTSQHSLTSVTFTPHVTSYDELPSFECQKKSNDFCSPQQLGNCNDCIAKPETAWPYMSGLARKYMKSEYGFEYSHSLFSMKPILKASEIDDSRPTVVRKFCENPTYVSVLSGKINTVYDLDEVLDNE